MKTSRSKVIEGIPAKESKSKTIETELKPSIKYFSESDVDLSLQATFLGNICKLKSEVSEKEQYSCAREAGNSLFTQCTGLYHASQCLEENKAHPVQKSESTEAPLPCLSIMCLTETLPLEEDFFLKHILGHHQVVPALLYR